jgi:sigma-B regulation protein RsbU (phosphoserine phosphatase)
MDVSVVIKNTMMYGFATISIAAIYFLIIYILGQSISVAIGTQFQTAIAGLIFIVFALVFQSTKDKFQDFLTARFYPEQFAYQKVLIKFSNDVSTVVGTENILSSMKETFVESLMLNNFGILIKEKKSDKFNLVKSVGIKNSGLSLDGMLIDDFISDKSLSSTQPVIEREDFTKVFPSEVLNLTDENIYTIIPMVIKSKVIGLLLFGLKRSGSQFAGKDIELLYAAANQSAIAIENARLYQSEAEKFKMERDLDLARKIQQGLLPTTIPVIKGLDIAGEMIPAMQVGGDYFDLLPVSESKLFVVVGDVSGKGLAASLYMAKLQTMIQLSCNDRKSPKEILIELNRHFYKSIERNSFVTMTLALFDNQAKILKFCRAGHLPLLMASNGNVSSFRTQGIGVGLEKGNIFESTLTEEEIPLKPGQTFAFFSDGITEAMNENNDLFGEENLQILLKNKSASSSVEIMDQIWSAVKIFKGAAEQNDDMTMVLVKVADEIQYRI